MLLAYKNSCEKTLYFSLCKKEKIVDLGMNSAILKGPPVFSNFCPRNTRYIVLKICRLIVLIACYR
jgi:hypothetical protein